MRSIRTYLERNVIRQSIGVLILMGCIAVATSYFLSRYKMTTDIKDVASSVSKAYRNRILEGDIKTSEKQIRELLHLQGDEAIFVLNPNRERIYKPIGDLRTPQSCPPKDEVCLGLGTAAVYLPIYFDSNAEILFGYLYLSRNVSVDWVFVGLVFLIFCIGFAIQLFGFSNMVRRAAWKLGKEIELWADRLNKNPKSDSPLQEPPFSELIQLKSSIEGLHDKIRHFEIEASNKAKLLLLRGIAHDILGPVAQMQLYCATLDKVPMSDEVRETIKDIEDSLERVSLIATQVKALNENQPPENFDFSEFVKEEVEQLRASHVTQSKNIQLHMAGSPDVAANITKAEASRILRNLVQNSINASAHGAKVTIDVAKKDNCAVLQVSDSGAGISKSVQSKVFEPDFTSKPGTGTGLGLAIVRHICVKREGLVSLESLPQKGTTVTVRLPLFEGGLA